MKAVQLTNYGAPGKAVSVAEIPRPVPGEGQILVKVRAASINPFDYKLIGGLHKDRIPLILPIVPGGDIAGVVEAAGAGVTDMKIGDEIYGGANILSGGSGAFAEFAVTGVSTVDTKPPDLKFEEAASLPLTGVSAVQALTEHIKIGKGQTILVHGGAGGIGSLAVQLAKAMGARVLATAGGDDLAYVRGLGADEVIDYRKAPFEREVHGVDAVYDTVGGEVMDRSLSVLRDGGVIVSMLGAPDEAEAKRRGIKAIGQQTRITRERLHRLSGYVKSKSVIPLIAGIFEMQKIRDALSYAQSGHPRGKVVLTIG